MALCLFDLGNVVVEEKVGCLFYLGVEEVGSCGCSVMVLWLR